MKEIRLVFDDKDFKALDKMKEYFKDCEVITSWEDFILKVCGLRDPKLMLDKELKGGKKNGKHNN